MRTPHLTVDLSQQYWLIRTLFLYLKHRSEWLGELVKVQITVADPGSFSLISRSGAGLCKFAFVTSYTVNTGEGNGTPLQYSSTLAWKIPWTEEPGRLQSMGSLRADTTEWLHFHFSLFPFMHWRRKWQPTPVFLPGESQGWGSLVGCRLWGCTELDTTEVT